MLLFLSTAMMFSVMFSPTMNMAPAMATVAIAGAMFMVGENMTENIMAVDNLSQTLVTLTSFIILLMMITSFKYASVKEMSMSLSLIYILMLGCSAMAFISLEMLMFYVMFELGLIPLLILILGWGYQIERMQATMYMMIYTLLGSLPLLVGLLMLNNSLSSLMWNMFKWVENNNSAFNVILLIAFMVKLPVYLFHLWLPKAHVEAPATGSMILAAVMLKLGGYGIYRMIMMMEKLVNKNKEMIISLFLLGGLITGLICLTQTDHKSLIAYSSVCHMGIMVVGAMGYLKLGASGFLIISIAHGFCSSALFYLVNLTYERFNSRQLMLIRGISTSSMMIMLFWFLFLAANFSVPPFMSLAGELMLMMTITQIFSFNYLILGMMIMIVGAYCVFIFTFILHGKSMNYYWMEKVNDSVLFVLISHFLPLLMTASLMKLELC